LHLNCKTLVIISFTLTLSPHPPPYVTVATGGRATVALPSVENQVPELQPLEAKAVF